MVRLTLILAGICVAAQPENTPYQVPQPQGWGKESIPLPPGFAPKMTWKGAEELRFAPGWLRPDSDTFFSYGIFFWLPGEQKVDRATMEKEMLVYYQGLAGAVLRKKKQEVDLAAFSVALKDMPGERRTTGEATRRYAGELKWIEPFATGKAQTLTLEVETWYCDKHKHRCVFICASPQPQDAAVWRTLRELRTGCTFP